MLYEEILYEGYKQLCRIQTGPIISLTPNKFLHRALLPTWLESEIQSVGFLSKMKQNPEKDWNYYQMWRIPWTAPRREIQQKHTKTKSTAKPLYSFPKSST